MNRKPGDWTCRSCQYINFSRRDSCHRCGDPRLAAAAAGDRSEYSEYSSFGGRSTGVRPGDWNCSCGAHNFASRASCFRCGSSKEEAAVAGTPAAAGNNGGGGGRAGWMSGDWICKRSGCGEHNFASRTECFRCSAPRDDRSGTLEPE